MENQKKTWLITGASQGIGLELVQQLLAKGFNVAATGRSLETLKNAVGISSEQFLPLQVDLLNEESIAQAVQATLQQFTTIDFLVNNAAFGLIGGIEESDKEEVQTSFDVNVFGLLNVTRAVLPHMRKANSGHIFNVSSAFGLIAGAGWGIYCATKFAVEGLSEALAQEVKPFNMHVTILEPGYFRTNFLSSGSIAVPKNPVEAYTEIADMRRKHLTEIGGTQPGDPVKAARVIIETAALTEPPLRLLLGSDAVGFAKYKVGTLQESINSNEQISVSTDFDQ